jgi:SsrA-binding protein
MGSGHFGAYFVSSRKEASGMALSTGKLIADNRRASFDYFLEDRFEAGISLLGTEIKSLRKHSVNIKDSYVTIKDGEAYILNMHIAPYDHGNLFNHDPFRTRKLLLHKREIRRMQVAIKEAGYTLVPTRLYFVRGHAKLEFALAKGKKNYDKRESEKVKSMDREAHKASKERYEE